MTTQTEQARIDRAVQTIHERAGYAVEPRVGVVLGSGLGAVADAMELDLAISYGDIPGFLPSTVAGHKGQLCIGRLAGVQAAVMQGRVHLYEGHDAKDVVLPIRVLCRLGVSGLVITNAAGGINPDFVAGDLMLIQDHLNMTGRNPLMGENEDGLGPRFPDMTSAYDVELRETARRVAKKCGVPLKEGVYAGLLGPSYESPAEVRMLGTLGADAVGMSTVLEVVAARHMGTRVVGMSVISNLAAGLSATPLSHDEVKETADAAQGKIIDMITGLAAGIGT